MKRAVAWFRWSGRLRRLTFLVRILVASLLFTVAYVFIERAAGHGATLVAYPVFFAAVAAACAGRLHDQARGAGWLLLALVPVLGPIVLGAMLVLRRGTEGDNQYGDDPRTQGRDYLQVAIHEPA